MAENLIEIKNLTREFRIGSFVFGKKMTAVDDVSLTIPGKEATIISVVGESGCGKTTLTKMVLRLLQPTKGEIFIDGVNVNSRRQLSNAAFHSQVQPIFQNPFEAFSSRRQVVKYLLDTAHAYGGAKSSAEAIKKVDEALRAVGLSYEVARDKYSTQFSGGELQRVSIARALITSPKLIVADEPVAMIDASMKMNIVNLFKSIRDQFGISFIYITHDLSTAYYVSDYIATLYRGSLIEFGRAEDIMNAPAHPYTELLMNSVPRVGDKWQKNVVMSEEETSDFAATCCKFAERCAYARDNCRAARPGDTMVGEEHKVLCFYPLNQKE